MECNSVVGRWLGAWNGETSNSLPSGNVMNVRKGILKAKGVVVALGGGWGPFSNGCELVERLPLANLGEGEGRVRLDTRTMLGAGFEEEERGSHDRRRMV